jgi:S1-C subfamily serine protease
MLGLTALAVSTVLAQSVPPKKDIPTIAKAANGAVASIIMSDSDGNPVSQGSGFLVSDDGLILTNYHVIAEGTSAVVKFPNGAFFVVDGVFASDKTRDAAIVRAHGSDFRTLSIVFVGERSDMDVTGTYSVKSPGRSDQQGNFTLHQNSTEGLPVGFSTSNCPTDAEVHK